MGKLIVSLDPGGTCGIALRMPDGTFQTTTSSTEEELYTNLLDWKPQIIVYEEFNPHSARVDKYMLYTIRLVGGIRAMCYALDVPGYAHVPFARKPFQEDSHNLLTARRRAEKIPFVIHEEDALAHLLKFEHEVATGHWKGVTL